MTLYGMLDYGQGFDPLLWVKVTPVFLSVLHQVRHQTCNIQLQTSFSKPRSSFSSIYTDVCHLVGQNACMSWHTKNRSRYNVGHDVDAISQNEIPQHMVYSTDLFSLERTLCR